MLDHHKGTHATSPGQSGKHLSGLVAGREEGELEQKNAHECDPPNQHEGGGLADRPRDGRESSLWHVVVGSKSVIHLPATLSAGAGRRSARIGEP